MNEYELRARIEQLREDRRRGASELGREAMAVAADAARYLPAESAADLSAALITLADELAVVRPSMAPLYNLAMRWRQQLKASVVTKAEDLRESAAEQAMELANASRLAVEQVIAHTLETIAPYRVIITHSLSSTLTEVFHRLPDKANHHVILTESRPLNEGHQLAALLSGWQLPATLITDAQLGLFVQRADVALVGADALLADGSVVNKSGTSLLALAAHESKIPFYVSAETLKQHRTDTAPPEPEVMAPAELGAPGWPGVDIGNVYFDTTPARLVSGWINEHGLQQRG
ncbi:MAG: translation initiation factor eIF-2B [Pseudomonadota bacterium]|nr:MAG: translation initiation factor eIF-2B [Pseudomonadota bacterium]